MSEKKQKKSPLVKGSRTSQQVRKGGLPSKQLASSLPAVKSDNYLATIYKYDLLSADEELRLARAWRDEQSLAASYQLVTSHLRLVPKIANKFKNYGLPMTDLISEGNLGLMHAVKKFDPEKGFRLTTYAMWWIRAAIQEYILSAWSLVRIGTTPARKKLFFSLASKKKQIDAYERGDLQPDNLERLEADLQVGASDIVAVNRAIAGKDQSLNHISYDSQVEPIELLVSDEASPEEQVLEAEEKLYRKQLLVTALRQLDEREREIFISRKMATQQPSLRELSERFNISRERVRQIESKTTSKVMRIIQEREAAASD